MAKSTTAPDDSGQKKLRKSKSYIFSKKFHYYTGHEVDNFKSFQKFSDWLHRPVDAAALGVFRICYGAAMLIDIVEERGGGYLDMKYGDPRQCHFPLFNFIQPAELPVMGIVYLVMWLGALGITLGYKFKLSCIAFVVPYWYIFLLDKPSWNNHSYLFGLCGCIFLMTSANHYCSLDRLFNPKLFPPTVPYWNYFLIKFQFFILYMFAGMKKFTSEWLSGYAMSSLGRHWLFIPFRSVLSAEMTDLLIIHWFTSVFDFSIAFLMTWKASRIFATPFMISFHLMNSRLFVIGMFPWVCLAEVPLFFRFDWPRLLKRKISEKLNKNLDDLVEERTITDNEVVPLKLKKNGQDFIEKAHTIGILLYCFLQITLPYSHFITKGYNNWTNGLYGYSWDMMVHTYETTLTSIKIVDNNSSKEHYLDPYAFTDYDRWTKYADMAIQYAKCIDSNIKSDYARNQKESPLSSTNISIYFDIWCSMNGRFQQRIFDPREDLLKASWSPFERTPWSLPLLHELNHVRPQLKAITNDVLSWSNYSDVIFVADFPGLTLDNYISPNLINVTLTVLDGKIRVQNDGKEYFLSSGQSISPTIGKTHKVTSLGYQPSSYMFTYMNKTMEDAGLIIEDDNSGIKPILPLWKEFKEKITNYKKFLVIIGNCILFLLYGVPIPIPVREMH